MSDFLHINHGKSSDRKELMKLLNCAFSFKEGFTTFETLLPKLYNEEYDPAAKNVILDVNGEMRAAVGLYYNTLTVCGEKLKIGGIGNVACHPDCRNNGYMRFCMAYCLDEMKQNMTDYSFLCGQKQRYAHYGYEHSGIRYTFTFRKVNVEKTCGKGKKSRFAARKITKDDTEILSFIKEVNDSRAYHAERPQEAIYDILCSWSCTPYAVIDGKNVVGWFVLNETKDSVHEIGYKNASDIEDIAVSALETSEKEEIKIFDVPAFDIPLLNYLSKVSERYEMNHPDFYNIFCYENVIRAFLKLKSTYSKLADGECVMLIEGSKLPEQIKISVKNNEVTVSETDEKPDIALTHHDAMKLVGSLYSERRNELKPECASWFPLPLFTYAQDNV